MRKEPSRAFSLASASDTDTGTMVPVPVSAPVGAAAVPFALPSPRPPQQLDQQWQQSLPPQLLQTHETHQQPLAQPPLQQLQPNFVQATSMDWQPATNCLRAQPPSEEKAAKRPRLA